MTTASSKVAPPTPATPPHNGFSLISNEKLLQLYSAMLKCRMLHSRIGELANGNKSAGLLAALSHEAAAVGVGLALLPGDTMAPSPLGFIPAFVKGLPLTSILSALAPLSAKSRPPYARLNLVPPSLGFRAQLERAINAAIANKKSAHKKSSDKNIVVAFCGSAGASSDHLNEAMREAGKRNLPILFVCHSDPDSEEIGLKAEEHGFPNVTVDADDAVAVYRVATEAIAHARRGRGPTLIDCKPWAPSGHSSGPRQKAGNPILRMEEYLTRKGLFDKKFKLKVTADFRCELNAVAKSD